MYVFVTDIGLFRGLFIVTNNSDFSAKFKVGFRTYFRLF